MIYIQAPTELTLPPKSIFLAGGISNCHNWQDTVSSMLKDTNYIVMNPRRNDFDVSKVEESIKQIEWEFKYLQMATNILFWFPPETVCPITLFEYGKWITSDKPLHVGCDPNYSRLFDIKVQTRLVRPKQIIHTSLDTLVEEVRSHV